MEVGDYIDFADRHFRQVFPGVLFGILSRDQHHMDIIHRDFALTFWSDSREKEGALGIYIDDRKTKKTYNPLELYRAQGHDQLTDFMSNLQIQVFDSCDAIEKLIYLTLVTLKTFAPEVVNGNFSTIADANK